MMRHQYLFTTKLFFFFRLLCGTLVSCGWTVRRDRVSLLTQKKLFPLLSEQLRGQRFKNSEYDTSVCNLMDHGGVVQADLEHLMTHLNFSPPPPNIQSFFDILWKFPSYFKKSHHWKPALSGPYCLLLRLLLCQFFDIIQLLVALIARLYGQAAFFLFIYKSFEADDTQMLSVFVCLFFVWFSQCSQLL